MIQRTIGLRMKAISQARKNVRMMSPKSKKIRPSIPITTMPSAVVARMSRISNSRS